MTKRSQNTYGTWSSEPFGMVLETEDWQSVRWLESAASDDNADLAQIAVARLEQSAPFASTWLGPDLAALAMGKAAAEGAEKCLRALAPKFGVECVSPAQGWCLGHESLLAIAIENKQEAAALALIEMGAKLGVENSHGSPIVSRAAQLGLSSVAKILAERCPQKAAIRALPICAGAVSPVFDALLARLGEGALQSEEVAKEAADWCAEGASVADEETFKAIFEPRLNQLLRILPRQAWERRSSANNLAARSARFGGGWRCVQWLAERGVGVGPNANLALARLWSNRAPFSAIEPLARWLDHGEFIKADDLGSFKHGSVVAFAWGSMGGWTQEGWRLIDLVCSVAPERDDVQAMLGNRRAEAGKLMPRTLAASEAWVLRKAAEEAQDASARSDATAAADGASAPARSALRV
jgi:hypothetical protein